MYWILKADEIFKDDAESTINIDSVFQEIVNIYDNKLLYVVHNSLLMMEEEQNTEHVDNYLNGLILILEPMNIKIRKWIMEKLAC